MVSVEKHSPGLIVLFLGVDIKLKVLPPLHLLPVPFSLEFPYSSELAEGVAVCF